MSGAGGSARRGFTLVELLAVIAILGILVAIMIPVASGGRQRAKSTECASNLRQIGIVMRLYANEHRRLLPKTFGRDGETPTTTWIQKLAPYAQLETRIGAASEGKARAAGIFLCPAYAYDPVRRAVPYAMNYAISPDSGSDWRYRIDIPEAPKLFLVIEIDENIDTWNPSWNGDLTWRHSGKSSNALFVDGHVETLAAPMLATDPRWRGNL